MKVENFNVSYGLKRPTGEQYSSQSALVSFSIGDVQPDEKNEKNIKESIRWLFGICRSEVEAQMQVEPTGMPPRQQPPPQQAPQGGGYGGNGGGNGGGGKEPSKKQIGAILAIGRSLGMSAEDLKKEANVNRFEELTGAQASKFIDFLKKKEAAVGGG